MNQESSSQEAVIAFLSNPSTYDGLPVERISTHGAHIFLAGDRAYKLKRAVRFPFMDFSTAPKRHAMLENELRINGAIAPEIYLEVRAIRAHADGRLGFGGTGPAMDWVLIMRRFDQHALLDHVAECGPLDNKVIDDMAQSIAAMHQSAPVKKDAVSSSFAAMALANITGLVSLPASDRVGILETKLRNACADLGRHMDERARNGFVRRCHGDLHLRNIVLLDGKPVPFDALEFDPELATGDVYYDLAFLLMDLEHRALKANANRLLNRYAGITDDLEGLRGLPLFLAVRAAVRAKVSVISTESTQTAEARSSALTDAETYIDLANAYLPAPAPCLIGIGGLSGTGKSTVAAGIAPHIKPTPGALVLRSDVYRKRLEGLAETTRLSPAAYTREASTRVYEALMKAARRVLDAGQATIVDAVFADPRERTMLEDIAAKYGIPFIGLWLDAPLGVRITRVQVRTGDASDADAVVAKTQEEYALGNMSWVKVDAAGAIADTQRNALTAVLDRLSPRIR